MGGAGEDRAGRVARVGQADPVPGTLSLIVTGRDRPGLTASLFAALTGVGATVVDVSQSCVHGHLLLAVDLASPGPFPTGRVLAAAGAVCVPLGLTVTTPDPAVSCGVTDPDTRSSVTVLARPLVPDAMAAVAARIAANGSNIDRIVRVAGHPVTALELEVSGPDRDGLRRELSRAAADLGIDVAVQPAGLYRRGKRLVIMDVDSTLVTGEVVELLARAAGCEEDVARVTAAAMRGELDFAGSLRERVALLAGLPLTVVDDVRRDLQLTPGARTLITTLKRLDYRCGIVSGGFTQVTDVLAAELGLDYARANTLAVAEGRLTGGLVGPVVDRAGKAAALREFAADAAVPISQTVAIGDGANDLDMLATAGLGVAFNAKPVVRAAADASVSVPHLDAVLHLLGITRDEIEEVDRLDRARSATGTG